MNQHARTHKITRHFRISCIILHMLLGLFTVTFIFPIASKNRQLRLIQWWNKRVLTILNIQVMQYGHPSPPYQSTSRHMMIANHISWLDIFAINSIFPLRFIAKSDIKSWPVFGYLASKANVLFIEREKKHEARHMISTATNSLKAGDNLCLFPEGTTTDGTEIKPFKSSLIEAAIQAKATLWPAAIRYPHPDGSINTTMAYAGDTTLIQSIAQILSLKQAVVEVHFLTPIDTQALVDTDRRTLTLHMQNLIKDTLKQR